MGDTRVDEVGTRALVAWCPDWPAAAAGYPPEVPAAVVAAERVVAVTAAARTQGVRGGLRRREAQSRCPDLVVVAADPGRDARAFEPVAAAIEAFTPGVEILRPGLVAFGTRGPSRYFGGDRRLAGEVAAALDATLGRVVTGSWHGEVGVADGRFAAGLAARLVAPAGGPRVVPVGGSPPFLAPLPVAVLPDPRLSGLLARLGLLTLGDLAALPAASVLARFGLPGAVAHRLARGLDERPLAVRVPAEDLAVSAPLDPPAERSDVVAFAARALAGELHGRLAARGLACTQVEIEAETEHGERLTRRWRHEGALDDTAIAERVRWQLDGWLSQGGVTAGLVLLRLTPVEVSPAGGRQLSFWGGASEDGRIARPLARVQGLLGPAGVVTAVLGGGRDPADAVSLVPWGDPRVPARPGPPPIPAVPPIPAAPPVPASAGRGARRGRRKSAAEGEPPWPGRLPPPAPAVTYHRAVPADVRDAAGAAVTVSARGVVSAAPAELSVAGGPWTAISAWAGPWPLEERWWERERRRARFQVVTAGGLAHLLTREDGGWWVEATYD